MSMKKLTFKKFEIKAKKKKQIKKLDKKIQNFLNFIGSFLVIFKCLTKQSNFKTLNI